MQISSFPIRSLLAAMTLAVIGLGLLISPVEAQKDADPTQKAAEATQQSAEAKLEELLDKLELLYQKRKLQDGRKLYVLLYERAGEMSKISIIAREAGTIGGEKLYGFAAWSEVARVPEGQTLSPAVIKLVTAMTDTCVLGSYSTTPQHDLASSACTGLLDGLSSNALGLNLLYVHVNRLNLKKETDRILAADK